MGCSEHAVTVGVQCEYHVLV